MALFSRSWRLFKSAWQVLRAEKSFLLYPALAAVMVVLVSALILGGGFMFLAAHPEIEQTLATAEQGGDYPPWALATALLLIFLYSLAVYFVINFFLTALVGAALLRLEGGDPSFGDGLRIARSRAAAILGYSAIAATLGLLLSLLRGRQGRAGPGAIAAGIGGLAWNVATFLVVPLLAAKGLGPITAIRESATLLRKTWGEQLTGSFGMGAAFGLLMLLVVIATFGLAGLVASPGRELPVVSIFVVGATLFALLAVISSALFGIFRGAVYLYADKGQFAPQFDRDMITQAFAPKG